MCITSNGTVMVDQIYYEPTSTNSKRGASGIFSNPLTIPQ